MAWLVGGETCSLLAIGGVRSIAIGCGSWVSDDPTGDDPPSADAAA
jgi:hypothetical protein